jgi:hypothetical protein
MVIMVITRSVLLGSVVVGNGGQSLVLILQYTTWLDSLRKTPATFHRASIVDLGN